MTIRPLSAHTLLLAVSLILIPTAHSLPVNEALSGHTVQPGEYISIPLPSGSADALFIQQTTSSPQGGALLLHAPGHNTSWPENVESTRRMLPEGGWSTLSMPLPPQAEAPVPERRHDPLPDPPFAYSPDQRPLVFAHIKAGLDYLNQQGLFNIVIIGFGSGAEWAARYMSDEMQDTGNTGYSLVLVNWKTSINQPALDGVAALSSLTIPVLDLFSADSPEDGYMASQRLAMARRQKIEVFTQVRSPGRSRFLPGKTDPLARRIRGWLNTYARGREEQSSALP